MYPELSVNDFFVYIMEPDEARGYRLAIAMNFGNSRIRLTEAVPIDATAFAGKEFAQDFNSLIDAKRACDSFAAFVKSRI